MHKYDLSPSFVNNCVTNARTLRRTIGRTSTFLSLLAAYAQEGTIFKNKWRSSRVLFILFVNSFGDVLSRSVRVWTTQLFIRVRCERAHLRKKIRSPLKDTYDLLRVRKSLLPAVSPLKWLHLCFIFDKCSIRSHVSPKCAAQRDASGRMMRKSSLFFTEFEHQDGPPPNPSRYVWLSLPFNPPFGGV